MVEHDTGAPQVELRAPAVTDGHYCLEERTRAPESVDSIRVVGDCGRTKFHRIALKEWFYACRVGGHILIREEGRGLLPWPKLVDECRAVLGDHTEIAECSWDEASRTGTLALRKTRPALADGDTIDRWTFGIITNGQRDEWVTREIESIRALGIPECEIIVCGTYAGSAEGIRYIPFSEKDDRGWITKKKNLICEAATYENLCITHDKFLFDPGFHQGMKRYGNYFDVLSCVIVDSTGQRAGDWETFGNHWDGLPKTGLLEYRDWDEHGFLVGAFYILKKSVWRKVRWDERLFWNEKEDVRLARDLWNAGFVTRFNPHSRVTMLHSRVYPLPIHEFNPLRLGRRRQAGLYYWYRAAGRWVKKYILGK